MERVGAQDGSNEDCTTARTDSSNRDQEHKSSANSRIIFDPNKVQYLQSKLQDDIIDSKEPLILSLIQTVYDEVKQLHVSLKAMAQALEGGSKTSNSDKAHEFFKDMGSIKSKLQT